MELSIIMPCFNNAETIKENTQIVYDCFPYAEIILVDDGSNDNTANIISEIAKNNKNIKIVISDKNYGKGHAFWSGFKLATGKYVALIDSDLQIYPKQLNLFLKYTEIYNVIIGNIRHTLSIVEYSKIRWLVSNCYNLFVRILFNIDLYDTQTGFKLFKYSVLKSIEDRVSINGFAFDVEILVMLSNKYEIIDLPVVKRKENKTSSINIKSIIKTFIDTIKIRLKKLT